MVDVIVQGKPVEGQGDAPKTKDRKLKQGATHYHAGRRYVGGESVPLTDEQAAAFSDKLEADEDAQRTKQNEGPGVETNFDPENEDFKKAQALRAVPTSHTPQDIGAKSPTPGMPDINPGNDTTRPRPPVAQLKPEESQGPQPPIQKSTTAAVASGGAETPLEKSEKGAPAAAPAKK
jgi:hypothetical protein